MALYMCVFVYIVCVCVRAHVCMRVCESFCITIEPRSKQTHI